MKIFHVETGCHLYGGALQVQYLMQGLARLGHRNVLLCDRRSPLAQAAQDVAKVYACDTRGDLDLPLVGRLWRLLRRERADLLHLHSRRGADLLGGIAGRLAGLPVLLTRRVDNREPRALVPLKYALFDHVVAISQGIAAVLRADGVPAARISCVPSAVDTDIYRPQRDRAWLAAETGIAPQQPVIGMVAQLIPRKGHRYLLAALPALLARHPAAQVLLLGRGPLQAQLQADIAAQGLADRVWMMGFRDDLPRLLPCLDLLVHPAEREGLGVSLLQAAACGVPIVASDAGGMPEVVQENGHLVPPGDVAALAAAMACVLDQPAQAARMGELGRALVQRRFSVAAMVAGNLAVYRKLLGGHAALSQPELATVE
jgi:glycosyltransferase involved in cell wall biosynthesis